MSAREELRARGRDLPSGTQAAPQRPPSQRYGAGQSAHQGDVVESVAAGGVPEYRSNFKGRGRVFFLRNGMRASGCFER